MPNYEELYYIARNNYYQAIENRNAIRRNTSELQGRKNALTRELSEKQASLSAIRQKKSLVQDALNKCRDILNNEFSTMKVDLTRTSEEYKKIVLIKALLTCLQSILLIYQVRKAGLKLLYLIWNAP